MAGLPSGSARWRARVADQARDAEISGGVELRFRLPQQRWVDLDTLVESTVAGLRDAGAVAPRLAGLDAILATRGHADDAGVTIRTAPARGLSRRQPPGPVALVVTSTAVPTATRASKRAWRALLADAWGDRSTLHGSVWVDVVVGGRRSLLAPLEVTLDGLEPVLGRDPRARDWQEFFPNDHIIRWLRIRRIRDEPGVSLRLGRRK